MKNYENYNDYSTKKDLNFDSKVVHGAMGCEPITGAVSFPIFQSSTFRHPELGVSTGFDDRRLLNPTRQELERTMAILEEGKIGRASGRERVLRLVEISAVAVLMKTICMSYIHTFSLVCTALFD